MHLYFQCFRDAIKAAIAYKNNSTDFMDEVMRELEVRDDVHTRKQFIQN